MNRHESFVERIIREAIEQGRFKDLQGKGQPLDLRENPFEDPDLRMVHRLLRNAGFAPPWLEESKEIDAELEQARSKLTRAWNIFDGKCGLRVHYELERANDDFRKQVVQLNKRIEVYNLRVPAAVFQKSRIDAEKLLSDMCETFVNQIATRGNDEGRGRGEEC
jgi:hypothetical protein